MTLIMRGGSVLIGEPAGLREADVLIDGETIVAVESELTAPMAEELDARGCLVVPGLVNSHTHATNNLLKASGDNWSLESLNGVLPALYSGLTSDDLYVAAAIGAVEMLRTGCTAAYDQFGAVPLVTRDGVDAVVQAYSDVGMRAVLAPVGSDVPGAQLIPGLVDHLPTELRSHPDWMAANSTESVLQIMEYAIRHWDRSAEGRIRIATAPVIPGQCSDELLRGCDRLVREFGVGLHTHVAETKVQALGHIARWGKSIIARLDDLGLLGPHFVAGHGVWITDTDMKMLADAGATVAHNPASNLKLGSGVAPIRELLRQGISIGLGTDGSLSSDNQNVFEAMRFAALVSKVRFPYDPATWVGSSTAWRMATTDGARLLGMAGLLGAVAPGYKADIVLLKADSPFLRPMNDVMNALVYSETGADVDTALVGGRIVLQHGRVVTVDEQALRDRAQTAADRLKARNVALRDLADRLDPYIASACSFVAQQPFPVNRYCGSVAADL